MGLTPVTDIMGNLNSWITKCKVISTGLKQIEFLFL